MGFSDNVAATVLRLSFGWKTEGADLRRCLDVWGSLYRQTHPSALSSHSFAA
jgi:cysteine sulfinate desulfinase/cysteine desulfurase-like protein